MLDIFINDEFSDTICLNLSCTRILDRSYMTADIGIDRTVLEGEVGVRGHCAVLHDEIFSVAKRLGAGDFASHEAEILCIPSEIFAIDL